MHNEAGNFETNKLNEFVFDAEEFGLSNSNNRVESDVASNIKKDILTDATKHSVSAELFERRDEVLDQDRYIESARLAMDADGSSRTKTIGREFSKLVQGVIEKDSDDPAKLNDEYDLLSRQAIRGMFNREIGGNE